MEARDCLQLVCSLLERSLIAARSEGLDNLALAETASARSWLLDDSPTAPGDVIREARVILSADAHLCAISGATGLTRLEAARMRRDASRRGGAMLFVVREIAGLSAEWIVNLLQDAEILHVSRCDIVELQRPLWAACDAVRLARAVAELRRARLGLQARADSPAWKRAYWHVRVTALKSLITEISGERTEVAA